MQCEDHDICSFAQGSTNLPDNHAHTGYYKKYCTGTESNTCVRKKIRFKYTGSIVPPNMLPDGSLMAETNSDNWDERAKEYLKFI